MRHLAILDGTAAARELRASIGAELGAHLQDATRDPARMHPLWTVFTVGEPVRASVLTEATSDSLVRAATRSDLLVEVEADGMNGERWLRATVCIVAAALNGALTWVASDFPWYDDDPEAVSGPGAATDLLIALVPSAPRVSVLDLGSGSGALGVALADGAHRLAAVDVNPRAIALTELTAALNGRSVSTRVGDFGGATGQYELVVCNPPFVLGRPTGHTVFRDAVDPQGYSGLARHIAPLLSDGGRGVYLTNWLYERDRPNPIGRLLGELSGVVPACDILILERAVVPVPDYVRLWSDDDELVDSWAAGLTDSGVTHVGTGAVLVSRPVGPDGGPSRVTAATAYDVPAADLSGVLAAWLQDQEDRRAAAGPAM